MIAHNYCWVLRRRVIRCAANRDCSSGHAVASGRLWADRFPCCSGRMVSPGEREFQDKTSKVSAKKNETAARLQEFSKLERSLDTRHTCPPAPTIRIIKSPTQ